MRTPRQTRLNMRAISSGPSRTIVGRPCGQCIGFSQACRRSTSVAISSASSVSPAIVTEWQASDAQTRSRTSRCFGSSLKSSRNPARSKRSRAVAGRRRDDPIRPLAERFDLEAAFAQRLERSVQHGAAHGDRARRRAERAAVRWRRRPRAEATIALVRDALVRGVLIDQEQRLTVASQG